MTILNSNRFMYFHPSLLRNHVNIENNFQRLLYIYFMNAFESLHKQSLNIPDWKKAERHAQATLVGRPLNSTHNIYGDNQCECCGHLVQKQPISLCQNTKQLQFIGIGFPLYFTFFKYCIMLMLIETISTCIGSLSSAMDNNYDFCINKVPKYVPHLDKEVECTTYFVYMASINEYLPKQEHITRLAYFLMTILYFIYMRDTLRKLIGYYDQRCTTFSDYSILLKHLPQKKNTKASIYSLLSQYDIVQVVLIGSFDHIEKMKLEMEEIDYQKKQIMKKIQVRTSHIKEFNKNLQYLGIFDEKLTKLETVFLQIFTNEQRLYLDDQILPQKVIISVETDEEKEEIIQKINKKTDLKVPSNWSDLEFQQLIASESPQPREIIWPNLNVPIKLKVRNYIIGWTITFSILCMISVIFYFAQVKITATIEHASQANMQLSKTAFYFLLIMIIFFNKFLLSPILHQICHFQKYFTKTKEEYGFTIKYLLCMFFTTAVMTVLVEAITNHNIYAHNFGVVQNETMMIIFTSLLIPFIWFVNPWTILIKIKQYYYHTQKHLSQAQANQIMEPMPYQLGKRYAEIVKLVWLVFLYRSLIPVGPILAVLGMILYYWIDKYNLLRKSSVKQAVSGYLTLRVMSLLEFSIILKCSGQIFFDMQIRYEYSIVSIVCLILGAIYLSLPKNEILQYFHNERFNKEQKKLSQCINSLGPSYSDLHPILGKNMMNFFESLNKKYQQNERIFESTRVDNKPLLSQITKMESEKVNIKLKNWKKEFLTEKQNIAKSNLLQRGNQYLQDL